MLQHIDNDNSLESLRELYEQDLAKPELDIIPEMCGCTHWHTRICQCVRALQGPCHRARCSKALHSLTRGTLVRSLVPDEAHDAFAIQSLYEADQPYMSATVASDTEDSDDPSFDVQPAFEGSDSDAD